jgi:hypothetical protein
MEDKLKARFGDGFETTSKEQLPLGHRGRFEEKLLVKKQGSFSSQTHAGIIYAAAASVALLLSLGYWMLTNTPSALPENTPMALHQVNAELAGAEQFLAASLGEKRLRADSVLIENPEFSGFMQQLTILEEEYAQLELALGTNNDNEKIIAAMIRNYRLRLELLEHLFEKYRFKKKIEQQHG